jgi:hypothetical protein
MSNLETMRKNLNFTFFFLLGILLLAACSGTPEAQVVDNPTVTLAPNVSMTPRLTATPVPTRTPLPTFTYTPSESPVPPTPSDTPTPTEVPPVVGIIASLQTVNVREGPGLNFSAIEALNPGTGVEVLGQSPDGAWINIRMEDNDEGWIAASLISIRPTETPIPTSTPSPDLTALFLGTPLPTSLFGGGTVTPTPPRQVVTPTRITGTPPAASPSPASSQSFLPVIDTTAINQTAIALAGDVGIATATRPAGLATGGATVTAFPLTPSRTPTRSAPTTTPNVLGTRITATPFSNATAGPANTAQGVDVFALCDNAALGIPAPTNLGAGSTIDVYWAWFAASPELIQQHVTNATYEVELDGVLLTNWRQGATNIRPVGNQYVIYWYVPSGPLAAGRHRIDYRVTWAAQISDGSGTYGPGTSNTEETGSCTFDVR